VQNKNPTKFYCKKGISQGNIPKIGGEKIKGNGEFYLYLHPLGT
jgi:hypothetical protein